MKMKTEINGEVQIDLEASVRFQSTIRGGLHRPDLHMSPG